MGRLARRRRRHGHRHGAGTADHQSGERRQPDRHRPPRPGRGAGHQRRRRILQGVGEPRRPAERHRRGTRRHPGRAGGRQSRGPGGRRCSGRRRRRRRPVWRGRRGPPSRRPGPATISTARAEATPSSTKPGDSALVASYDVIYDFEVGSRPYRPDRALHADLEAGHDHRRGLDPCPLCGVRG